MKLPAAFLVLLVVTLGAADATKAQTTRELRLSDSLRQEDIELLAAEARAQGDAVRGAILFAQNKLGCVKCHQRGSDDRLGPDLNALAPETTDVYLVESLLAPSRQIKEGYRASKILTASGEVLVGRILRRDSDFVRLCIDQELNQVRSLPLATVERIEPSDVSAMPADLVDQLANRQQFLDLCKYLMDLASASPASDMIVTEERNQELSDRIQGLALIDELRCTQCHQGATANPVPAATGPNLVGVAARIDPDFLMRFIEDPAAADGDTSMPNVFGGVNPERRREQARAIAAYLASLTDEPFTRSPIDPASAARGKQLFHRVGCVACHSPRDDSGRELFVETSLALGDLALKYSVNSLASFLESPHLVRQAGRMPNMKLTHWEAIDLANYLAGPTSILGGGRDDEFAEPPGPRSLVNAERTSPDLVNQGRLAFHSHGCVRCHETGDSQNLSGNRASIDAVEANASYPKLAELRPDQGCLSDSPDRTVRYDLTDRQRELIQTALSAQSQSLSTTGQLQLAMTTLRCYQCHERNEIGGVSGERDLYFHSADMNLGPQGRIPPNLSHVGAKLKPAAMRQVLVGGQSVRPYLDTRMPLYGASNVESLIPLFAQLDQSPKVELIEIEESKEMRDIGVRLVGRDGLNCVACHTFQNKPAQTMPAVDLTTMGPRLQPAWFAAYMRDPQKFCPGTVMPSFWPGGVAIRKDILDGDAGRQIAAIWRYLQDGRQARTPSGLKIEPIELVADQEAIMLRRKYPEIGKRGIGVGYPKQVNLAFDAEQMRLAMVWRGKFADPGAAWRGQGSGNVRPLGRDRLSFAAGPDLDDAQNPWAVDDGRPADHHFRGYRLDEQRRPAFQYVFDSIEVEDYAIDQWNAEHDAVGLKRLVRLQTDQRRDGLRFRIASGNDIEQIGPREFLIDSKLVVIVDNESEFRISNGEPQPIELFLLLDVPAGETKLTMHYLWPDE